MKDYITLDNWKVIEDKFNPEFNRITEGLCSLGNGYLGQRGTFEEKYSGDTHLGNYVGGVYYPDKNVVAYWKNGFPKSFVKVPNITNWLGISVLIDGIELDLNNCSILNFQRTLNMKEGYLERTCQIEMPSGQEVKIHSKRFISLARKNIAAINYSVTPINCNPKIEITSYLNSNTINEWGSSEKYFCNTLEQQYSKDCSYILTQVKISEFQICTSMVNDFYLNDQKLTEEPVKIEHDQLIGQQVSKAISKNDSFSVTKYISIADSLNYPAANLHLLAKDALEAARAIGFSSLVVEQANAWKKKWELSDVTIAGDVAAQQGIRFTIFHLNQTYTGDNPKLNIGPKGFTGEVYGGGTYWDTEAYCFWFYLSTASQDVAKNLLIYRYNQLPKAIENATILGFTDGAALYPMVTMNGEESQAEWEITFEEVHRNGAIAYAIYNYIRYSADWEHLADYGLEVLIGIARFWKQRTSFSKERNKYVILGVTGPNEYENNVNNNWYTNYIACWCMSYAKQAYQYVKENHPDKCSAILKKTNFHPEQEITDWDAITSNMHFPFDDGRQLILQQDGFLDKDLMPATEINPNERPIHQHWSWDRILRSCFIKQADVLQGFFFFEDNFSVDELNKHFEFYEPMTVHESSLSSCVYSILAGKLKKEDLAYKYYLNASRLDLNDYNNDTKQGLHITSMAGSWMSIVQGFAGMRVKNSKLYFEPFTPKNWDGYAFKIFFRENLLKISINENSISIDNESGPSLTLTINNEDVVSREGTSLLIHLGQ